MNNSPFDGFDARRWSQIRDELIKAHPLQEEELVEAVLQSWESIFESTFGRSKLKIGEHIFPKPQIIGFLLHELIPLELSYMHPGNWRVDKSGSDKDLVCTEDERFSVEIKTSSNPKHIFGNRSFAQESTSRKKSKSGYYLTVNFDKFKEGESRPSIRIIRFGWLDNSDWQGQQSATGQQASLSKEVEENKLKIIYQNQ